MNVLETVKAALGSLRVNALRSLLSMLGIVIGVAAVIAVVSIGTGSQQQVLANISALGSNVITVSPAPVRGGAGRVAQDPRDRFTLALGSALENLPGVARVNPQLQFNGLLAYGGTNVRVPVLGVGVSYPQVLNYGPALGRFLVRRDLDARANVIVLGSEVAADLFGNRSPVGENVVLIVNGRRFLLTVVGVMESKGRVFFTNFDGQVYIPVTTAMERIQQVRFVNSFVVQAASGRGAQDSVTQVEFLLTRRLGSQDLFRVSSQEELLTTIGQVGRTLSLMLGGIASIALLVGGIGIMNIMLVSVTERTREIGIRKALGARDRDILRQFLVESLTLSATGGLIGIGLGWLVSSGLAAFAGWPAVVSPASVFLSLGFSGAVGLFFGIYPAVKAAALDPVQALSFE